MLATVKPKNKVIQQWYGLQSCLPHTAPPSVEAGQTPSFNRWTDLWLYGYTVFGRNRLKLFTPFILKYTATQLQQCRITDYGFGNVFPVFMTYRSQIVTQTISTPQILTLHHMCLHLSRANLCRNLLRYGARFDHRFTGRLIQCRTAKQRAFLGNQGARERHADACLWKLQQIYQRNWYNPRDEDEGNASKSKLILHFSHFPFLWCGINNTV